MRTHRFISRFQLLFAGLCLLCGEISAQTTTPILQQIYPEITPVLTCEELRSLEIPNTQMVSVEETADGNIYLVTAVVNHPPASNRITVWIALPTKNWNGRFLGTGGGGFMAGNPGSLTEHALKGFATGATDGGNPSAGATFGYDAENHRLNWQGIQDFAYNGLHYTNVLGKILSEAFYGKPVAYSYFVGGSTGGRQGMMLAQRFPEDYDGIFSAFPAINWNSLIPWMMQPQVVMEQENNYVSKAKLKAVTEAVIAAEDGRDGVIDGVIENPFLADWDPSEFVGTIVKGEEFTERDADVVRKIWDGAVAADGTQLWYGLTRGTDMTALAGTKGRPLAGRPFDVALNWLRYFLALDPKIRISDLSYTDFELFFNQSAQQYKEIIGTDNPDLSAFKASGGKVLIMHGLSDNLIPPQGSIDYYEKVIKAMGGYESTIDFARFYLLPALDHSFSGAGPNPAENAFEIVVKWVEEGIVPDEIIGEKKEWMTERVLRSKPVYPYPYSTRYKGTGDINEPSSYERSMDDAESYRSVLIK